jgi:hypothetical protein
MDRLVEANMRKLDAIYRRKGYDGPALVANPPYLPMIDAQGRDYTLSDRPISELAESVLENYRRRVEFLEAVSDDGVPYARVNTATHLYAAAFGCRVHLFGDSNPCALPLVRSAAEADRIELPDVWKSRMLGRVFDMAHEVRRRLGPDAPIGPPDVQTGFDTACLIWNKEDLYTAMGDQEGRAAVKRLAAKCAAFLSDFLAAYRREFGGTSPCHCPDVWSPPDLGPWVSNDECGALSTAMAEEFCMPELLELSRRFGSLGMHCCASAEHQFDSWKKIPGFYALNRVPARQGFAPLIEHFGGKADPVHVLIWTEDPELDRLLERVTPEMRFIIVRGDMERDQARRWLDETREATRRRET